VVTFNLQARQTAEEWLLEQNKLARVLQHQKDMALCFWRVLTDAFI